MHELSIAGAVVETAVRHAEDLKVSAVRLRVGELRQVVPASLEFYFELVARDTVCEGARLEIVPVETVLACGGCGGRWTPTEPAFRCPRCSSGDVTVVAGDELEVESLDVQEEACIARG